MDISAHYSQIIQDDSVNRTGGVILKGHARNTRQPVHMIFLVDTSGSMELDDKLISVKRSIQLMLSLLNADDRISLITFSDDSKILLSRAIPTQEERAAIQYRVSSMNAHGSTNLSAALLDVRNVVEPSGSGRKQGLLILTDGHANIGVHSDDGILSIMHRIQTEAPELAVTTVAYGADHNSELLTKIASSGGGAYNVVQNLEDVASVFGDILGGFASVVAQKVSIRLPVGATAITQFSTKKETDGSTTIYLGDIYADTENIILFESSPTRGSIQIQGTDMATLNLIQESVNPSPLRSLDDVPSSIVMAEYKHKVSNLLIQARDTRTPALKREIETLIANITNEPRIAQHPLRPMLLEDLENVKELMDQRVITREERVMMSQHSAYLGLSRGLRTTPVTRSAMRRTAATPGAPSRQSQDPQNIAQTPDNLLSPFASRLQNQYSQAMREMTSQMEQVHMEEVD